MAVKKYIMYVDHEERCITIAHWEGGEAGTLVVGELIVLAPEDKMTEAIELAKDRWPNAELDFPRAFD